MPDAVIDAPTTVAPLPRVEPAQRRERPVSRRRRLGLPGGSDALLLIAVVAFAAGLINGLVSAFSVDSWLELVAGRDIWNTGIPHIETLTAISHGARWIDQQWLAQLASYVVYKIGGLGFLGVVNVAMMVTAVGACVVYARRRGARPWIVLLMFGVCLWQIVPAREVRTQAFAMPLLVATLILLSADSRHPSRRVYWCLPLLVLWANLHGTVTIGAALVSLRGLTLAWERRSQLRASLRSGTGLAAWRRPLVLMLGAPLTLFLTPYGLQAIPYYESTLMNSSLKHAVTEWQPITSVTVEAIPFFILAGLVIWSFGRRPTKTTSWEKATLLLLAAGSIDTIRNSMLFAFAALIMATPALDSIIRRRPRRDVPVRTRLNTVLSWSVIGVLGIAVLVTIVRPARVFEHHYQREGVLGAVTTATHDHPGLKVLTDVRFADWLLWRDPALRGKIASDARWEVLPAQSINSLENMFSVTGPDWKAAARGYGLLVLDRSAEPDAVSGFLAERGRRVLYNDGTRIVILRAPADRNSA